MVPFRWLLALVLAAAPARVAIASPIAFTVGGGIRIPLSEAEHPLDEPFEGEGSDGTTPVGALGAMIGYRVWPRVAIGVRSAVSWREYRTRTVPINDEFHDGFSEIPVDVALATQLEAGRVGNAAFWVTPWIGRRFTRVSHTVGYCFTGADRIRRCDPNRTYVDWRSTGNILGITTGLDIMKGSVSQIALFVEAQIAERGGSALGVGLAYRR